MSKAISIRINSVLRGHLDRRAAQTKLTVSEIARDVLESEFRPRPPAPQPTSDNSTAAPAALPYEFPPELEDRLRACGCGEKTWDIRNETFVKLLVLCESLRLNGSSGQDDRLCAELLSIGREHRLLPEVRKPQTGRQKEQIVAEIHWTKPEGDE
jgi:hypothetical protein